MSKNVKVVDGSGKEYEATYPKRARGLVKNGRARFVSENCIALTCPPKHDKHDLEERNMTEQVIKQSSTLAEPALTVSYILRQLEKIQQDNAHVLKALEELADMPNATCGTDCGAPADLQGQAKADSIANVVLAREQTNQQLLSMYIMLYTDLVHSGHNGNT